MYSKKLRLPLGKNFRFRPKKSLSSSVFTIRFAKNGASNNRFGIIIPSSSVKKSVRRHFWKRVIADHIKEWPNIKTDFLILVRPGIGDLLKKEAKEELDKVFKPLAISR